MRLLRTMLALLCLSFTTACIEGEIELSFVDDVTVESSATYTMARQLFDMTGSNAAKACPGGEHTLSSESFTCRGTGKGRLEALLNEQTLPFEHAERARTEHVTFQRTSDNSVKVTVDFAAILREQKVPEDATASLAGAEDLLRAALAGHDFVFKIKAYKILSTTGELSDDETEAKRVIPVANLLDSPPNVGKPFVTEVQLKKPCRFRFFCK
ncbi:hypothetical protein KO498_05615 [Lentibacter algarum]|uniref:hypothetical protein n=1 Tax=Lentibacter algarum TaxID=576131 RepID=UPI001C07CE1E|nr:hypothetical protein [Lentibacter algarum]MBU2981286.1 hypothetical protein [Lentibacter algarum]